MKQRRSAFTLIELLASATLSALLMVGVLSLFRSSLKETRFIQTQKANYPDTTIFARQLRRDIKHARGLQTFPSGMQLYGYLGSDFLTGMPTQRLGMVRYYVTRDARGVGTLWREELGSEDRSEQGRREAIWHGVGEFSALAFVDIDEDEVMDVAASGGLPPVPQSVSIRMRSGNGGVLMNETIFHHEVL